LFEPNFSRMRGNVHQDGASADDRHARDDHNFFATVGEAVSAYLDQHSVEWLDWEGRKARG
jgi:hypothetical protein